jgi:hypothetical protein
MLIKYVSKRGKAMKKRYMYLFFLPIILLLFVFSTTSQGQGGKASESQGIAQSSSSTANWRADYQQAYKHLREHQKYSKNKALLTKIGTELKSSEKTMTAAEQLLSKKPINKQAANSLVKNIDNQTKNLDNLTSALGGETLTTTPLSSTQTSTQLTQQNMLATQSQQQTLQTISNISKQLHDMRMSIIRNLR